MPIGDTKREQIVKLVQEGTGRNETAKLVGVSSQTVSSVAAKAGLSFDRAATAQATEARKEDAKARRTALGLEMLGDLEAGRLRLREVESGREFQAVAQGLDALMRSYVNLTKMEPDDGGIGEARGIVGSILGAIRTSVEGVPRLNPGQIIE